MASNQPIDVIIVGVNLNSFGFVGLNYNVEGLALNTFGFLWPCDAIWTPADEVIATTAWAGCTLPATGIEICAD